MWEAQSDSYEYRIKAAEVNTRRRAGECNLWVKKDPDRSGLMVFLPLGAPTIYNKFGRKADRLCLKALSHLYQDPAQPDAIPATGEDSDRDAAQLTTRILTDLDSESCLNDVKAHKDAWDLASNWSSAYIWYSVDPKGGGRQPVEVMAQPTQMHVEEALAMPGDVPKYVKQDGTLTDSPGEAALRWMPRIIRQIATPGHVRLTPATASDLWDADGLLYREYYPWQVLKGWFPELEEATPEERDHAIQHRPKDTDHLLPKRYGKKVDPKPKAGHEDDGLACLTIHWCVEQSGYPDGAYVVTVGDELVPRQAEWILKGPDGKREKRDLPWTQVQQWKNQGLMDFLGPNNEFREQLYGRFEEWMERLLNRKTLLPFGSTIQPKDMQNPFATTLYYQPGYEPRWEEVPGVPKELPDMIARNEQEMQDAASLPGESAEGLTAPNANSGRQALAILSQQQASLSDLVQNANRARVRSWRIKLQCLKADYSVPQLLKYQGADGGYVVKRWTGSDVGSTKDVQIQRGTGTTFNPFQKAQLAGEIWASAGKDPEELQEIISSGLSPFIAIQDNAVLMRVRRQLSAWEEGPPQEPEPVVPPEPAVPPMPMIGPMGEDLPPPPPQPDPRAMEIFEPVKADMAPINAKVRVRELNLAMCKASYLSKPVEWRLALEAEYDRMTMALMPPPMAPPGQNAAPGQNAGQEQEPGPGMPVGGPEMMQGEAEATAPPVV
jgi:hypothetical protein